MMNKPKLTFAIPTRNRIDNLKENLRTLVPQLDEDSRLLIIDNCSYKPVQDEIDDVIPSNRLFEFGIVRNSFDIGGNANIVRCYELCRTQWLCLIGDSRKVSNNIVTTLKRYMLQFPEATLINFYSPSKEHSPRHKLTVAKGKLSFVKEMGSLGNIILVGNSLINMRKIKSISYGYQYCYSNAPQFVIPLMNMNEDSVCILSPEKIIESCIQIPEGETRLSLIDFWIGSSSILDLPLEHAVRVELAKKISGVDVQAQPYLCFFNSLLLFSVRPGKNKQARYYFHRVCSSRYYYNRSITMIIKLFCTYVLLRLPFITRMLIDFKKKFIK
ncbi:MAG: hypothetical protein HZC52_01635 [Planctomycetes bacterium]|nr:hypothetical protein [Planctomycetota bacterium]